MNKSNNKNMNNDDVINRLDVVKKIQSTFK